MGSLVLYYIVMFNYSEHHKISKLVTKIQNYKPTLNRQKSVA